MLSWAIGFFAAALVAAFFGFGAIASSFMGIAQILFYVFLALFLLFLVMGLFFRGSAHTHDGVHVHRDGGMGAGALLAMAALIGVGVYAWMDHDMSAERVGRVIDQSAASIAADAGNAIGEAGERIDTVSETTTDNVREDAAQMFETASDNVRNTD